LHPVTPRAGGTEYAALCRIMIGNYENMVIAHFAGGALLKGTTLDFFPSKETFHLLEDNGDIHEVTVTDLKAVFFVKSFDGNPQRQDRRGFFTRYTQGKKVMVEFHDEETLFGYTLSYSTKGLGFFMFPGDPDSNNAKIFIVHRATRRVKVRSLQTNYSSGHYSQ
jgi:hypothetical protein